MDEAVGGRSTALYDGYGACPLAVERGKVVLAEFGWGGKLLPSFPRWLIDGTRPSRLAWLVKTRLLPQLYWHVTLPGREALDPLAKPTVVPAEQSGTK
jgi:sulfide:quinone oxidoreductase